MATGDKKRAVMTDDINNSGSSYPVMPLKTIDQTPTAGNTDHLISSAGVKSAFAQEILYITIESITALPYTVTNPAITDQHVVLDVFLGTPHVRTRAWTVVTSNGSLTIRGTGDNYDGGIIGETSMTLKLGYIGTYF